MSTCIKTGVKTYLTEYNGSVAADLHSVDGVLIIRFNPNSWDYKKPKEKCDCVVIIGNGYIDKDAGIIVAPISYSCHW